MNEINGQDVVFIDAYNLIYRAYHGNQNKLANSNGISTNAILTVARMLLNLPEQFDNLTYAVAVFDGGGNFRTELDPNYKANRKEMPEDLQVQMPYIKQLFEILGWPMLQAVGVEADDVIATLAKRSSEKGFNTYIISSDKDFRQIITDNLHVIDSMNDTCYDREITKEKMGVYPENVAAYLALLGDASDNVMGIEGVGKGSAVKLLNQYGSLQAIIDNKDELKNKMGENIRAAIDSGQLLRDLELVTVKLDVDISLTSKELRLKEVSYNEWKIFCLELELRSLFHVVPKSVPGAISMTHHTRKP